jgi:uncharacterized protein YdhG (YjbR/CyaY superfamily)
LAKKTIEDIKKGITNESDKKRLRVESIDKLISSSIIIIDEEKMQIEPKIYGVDDNNNLICVFEKNGNKQGYFDAVYTGVKILLKEKGIPIIEQNNNKNGGAILDPE